MTIANIVLSRQCASYHNRLDCKINSIGRIKGLVATGGCGGWEKFSMTCPTPPPPPLPNREKNSSPSIRLLRILSSLVNPVAQQSERLLTSWPSVLWVQSQNPCTSTAALSTLSQQLLFLAKQPHWQSFDSTFCCYLQFTFRSRRHQSAPERPYALHPIFPQPPQGYPWEQYCRSDWTERSLFFSILGCVRPLQEAALRHSPPTFSVLC